MPESVIQDWVGELTFKQQTVLLCALRGCDGLPKEDKSKQLVRWMRSEILKSADSIVGEKSFMGFDNLDENIDEFLKDLDHYPVHWLFHFMHATQILNYYKHTENAWIIHHGICRALHVNVENVVQHEERLRDNY